jgi:hypothetical protein
MTRLSISLLIIITILLSVFYVFRDEIMYMDDAPPTVVVVDKLVPYEVVEIKEVIKQIYVNKVVYKYITTPNDNVYHLVDDSVYTNTVSEIVAQALTKLEERKKNNRVTALLGYGRTGYHLSADGSNVTSSVVKGPVYGLQYARRIVGDVGVAFEAQSNLTFSLGVGLDF